MNTITNKLMAEQLARRAREITLAYLAGYITRAERDHLLLLAGVV